MIDKPRQADGVMPAIIAPDLGVAILILQEFPVCGSRKTRYQLRCAERGGFRGEQRED